MAHGSKKWIRDYSGRIKRSSDRTRKDWKGDLHDWDYDYNQQYGKLHDGSPCPQCKGVGKDIRHHRKLVEKIRKEEYSPLLSAAVDAWHGGDDTWTMKYAWQELESRGYFDYTKFSNAFWDEKGVYPLRHSQVDIKTMLCHKCRFKYETERSLWKGWMRHGSPGWYGRMLNQQYRAEVKNILARAKFDEDLYDVLPEQKGTIQYWY